MGWRQEIWEGDGVTGFLQLKIKFLTSWPLSWRIYPACVLGTTPPAPQLRHFYINEQVLRIRWSQRMEEAGMSLPGGGGDVIGSNQEQVSEFQFCQTYREKSAHISMIPKNLISNIRVSKWSTALTSKACLSEVGYNSNGLCFTFNEVIFVMLRCNEPWNLNYFGTYRMLIEQRTTDSALSLLTRVAVELGYD